MFPELVTTSTKLASKIRFSGDKNTVTDGNPKHY
jgi:hypothetical protein